MKLQEDKSQLKKRLKTLLINEKLTEDEINQIVENIMQELKEKFPPDNKEFLKKKIDFDKKFKEAEERADI